MSVSNYSGSPCNYSYTKLKDVLYLVNEEYKKDIEIDDGEAYIESGETPVKKIEGFNIKFNEQTSLDERYKFQKTITISLRGYVTKEDFYGNHFAIIESIDGTLWMVNVDFPSKITYTFNLSEGVCQTDFTFSSLSNFPTLKLTANLNPTTAQCYGYTVNGIEKLELLEKDYAALDVQYTNLTTTALFKTVDFLKKTCAYSEVFDGDKYTSTLSFNILFDNNQPSWQYNLLEFLQNRYSAIITAKGHQYRYFAGFDTGLQPSYTIQTGDNGTSDLITITLVEASTNFATIPSEITPEETPVKRYRYARRVSEIPCYECVGLAQAMYHIKEQVDSLGNPTGNFLVLEGYEEDYTGEFNIVGTFDEEEYFDTNECKTGQRCDIDTTLPSVLDFDSVTSETFSWESSCDWEVLNVPYGITVSPMSGNGESIYFFTVANSIIPTDTLQEMKFKIKCCSRTKTVKVRVGKNIECVTPNVSYIDCNAQTVQLIVRGNCTLNMTSIDPMLTYSQDHNYLYIDVPMNTGSGRTFAISATNCNCSDNVTTFSIVQSEPYSKWVEEGGYICSGGSSYTVERKYTGTTADNITGATSETRPKNLIQSGDTRCGAVETYIFDGHYYCINGDKYKALEQVVNGNKTGLTKLGEMVESASSFCQQTFNYKWELSSKYECSGTTSYYLYQKYLKIGTQDWIPDYPNVWSIDAEETMPMSKKQDNDPTCGYIPPSEPIYRWVDMDSSTNWICDDCPQDINYFKTTALGTTQIFFNNHGQYIDMYYSLDGLYWSKGEASPVLNSGDTVYWKASGITPTSGSGIGSFDSGNYVNFNVGGNILSLVYGDDYSNHTTITNDYQFKGLFAGSGVYNAGALTLPTNVTKGCYEGMFYECGALIVPPAELPATALTESCYKEMFKFCEGMTIPPSIHASTMAASACSNMFDACSALINAPTLSATTLAPYCYSRMFGDCWSLQAAPALPATALTEGCYLNMFKNCLSIQTITLPASTLVSGCYTQICSGCESLNEIKCWATSGLNYLQYAEPFSNVASTGTFYKIKRISYPSGVIPSGWRVLEYTSPIL